MIRHPLTVVFAISCMLITAATGCSWGNRGQFADNTIAVGQRFTDAVELVRRAGYALHDAGELQTAQHLYGFTIELPGDRGLLVCHDPQTNWVNLVEVIDGFDGPRGKRMWRRVQRYEVLPATSSPDK